MWYDSFLTETHKIMNLLAYSRGYKQIKFIVTGAKIVVFFQVLFIVIRFSFHFSKYSGIFILGVGWLVCDFKCFQWSLITNAGSPSRPLTFRGRVHSCNFFFFFFGLTYILLFAGKNTPCNDLRHRHTHFNSTYSIRIYSSLIIITIIKFK